MNETLYKYDAIYDIFYPTTLEDELRLETRVYEWLSSSLKTGEK